MNKLNKDKAYCCKCYHEGIITELSANENEIQYYEKPNCNHTGRYFSYLKWCDDCKDFTSHRGFNANALCYRCIMKNNCKEAINKGLHSSQNPETSLMNKELHQRTINSQIKNGTFNMMDKEIHKKATKNKMKKYAEGNSKCKCGNIGVLNSFGLCSKCQSKIAQEIVSDKYCKTCNEITRHNGSVCLVCHPESDVINKPNFITKNNIRFYRGIEINELIRQLDNNEIEIPIGFENRLGIWTYNRKDILNDNTILLNNNFNELNGIKYYKNEPIKNIINKLNSEEYDINDYPGWNKRFGEWYYHTENILTGKIHKLNNSLFEEKDDQLYYYDKNIEDYILWEKYKEKFQNLNNINLSFINEINNLYSNSFIQTTFREQESLNWSGTRQAFEQDLIDKDISWFAYIKFFIDRNDIIKQIGRAHV